MYFPNHSLILRTSTFIKNYTTLSLNRIVSSSIMNMSEKKQPSLAKGGMTGVGLSALTPEQRNLARQFATLAGNDFVAIQSNTTVGDIINSLLFSTNATAASEDPTPTKAYEEKYYEKLLRRARELGFGSIEEMMADQKNKSSEQKNSSPQNPQNDNEDKDKSSKAKSTSSSSAKSALPSYAKKLDQIVNVDMLRKEEPERISAIWNQYHADKDFLSGTIQADVYKNLSTRGRKYPTFVLPLPRDEGYEMYYMQFNGDQVYYTSLSELKLRGEGAKPHFVMTHYTDLVDEKGIVLMRGELGDQDGTSSLSLPQAQNLVYQTQLFYVTGNSEKQSLVDDFTNKPQEFDFNKLIQAIETLK